MQVGSQAIIAKTFNKHLVARAHAKRKNRRTILLALSLTSMVDMFSLLVIFLLQTFSTSPEMLMTKDVRLPTAQSGREIVDAPVLSVTKDGVFLDQKLVGPVAQVLQSPDDFMDRLKNLRELWQKTHPDQKFKGEMNFQAHREVSSVVVAKLMGMLPTQAYDSIQLIVTSGGN